MRRRPVWHLMSIIGSQIWKTKMLVYRVDHLGRKVDHLGLVVDHLGLTTVNNFWSLVWCDKLSLVRSNPLHPSVDEFMQEGMWITLLGRGAWVIYLKETHGSTSCQEIWLQGVEQGRILDWKMALDHDRDYGSSEVKALGIMVDSKAWSRHRVGELGMWSQEQLLD